jgi:hypothetical protein
MGMFSFVLSIVAILLAGAAIGMQLTSTEFDPNSCSALNSGTPSTLTTKSCNEICGSKQCLSGLARHHESINIGEAIEQIAQSNLVSCDEQVAVGTSIETKETETQSLDCICCG